MINPSKITNYDLSDNELEEAILFWILAAGKNGTVAARCLDTLMRKTGGYVLGPFEAIRLALRNQNAGWLPFGTYKKLSSWLKESGVGCYNHKARTISELTDSYIDLRRCTPEDLESIYGIGRKTSRCFILHSRAKAQCAGLDTHILCFLDMIGVGAVPKNTPSSKKEYLRLEKEFLDQAKKYDKTPAELDLVVWNELKIASKIM